MKKITFSCPECRRLQVLTIESSPLPLGERVADRPGEGTITFTCAQCPQAMTFIHLNQDVISHCPACNCQDLHQHKDFNKTLGLLIFIVGAVFAPWTYYASLIAALILDALLYPFFPWMIICYRCEAELRGWPKNAGLGRFNHEVAAHYAYGRKN